VAISTLQGSTPTGYSWNTSPSDAEVYWDQVLFSYESKFNIFRSDIRQNEWRKPKTALDKINLAPTVKHGGGKVMVWGCMSSAGVGQLVLIEGIMDKTYYLNILRDNIKKSASNLSMPNSFTL